VASDEVEGESSEEPSAEEEYEEAEEERFVSASHATAC
jgi:hypothetical protein